MLPQNKDHQVPLQNAVPPGCSPQVLSQFVDSSPFNLASLSPHLTLPPSHLPLPSPSQAYSSVSWSPQSRSPGPHLYSSDSKSDFVPLPSSSSLPSPPTFFGQNCSRLPSPHTSSSRNFGLCLSPPLSSSSSLSQLQNSSPGSCQSPSHLQDLPNSTRVTSPSPSVPSPGIPSNKQTWQGPPSGNTRSPGAAEGCMASKLDPAEFQDPEALAQALALLVGRRRIARDLKILFLQHLWLGTTGQPPVLEYPICLACLQPRTPSCPTLKHKTGPRLLAFPQLLPPAEGQESGPLRLGIGFSLRLPPGQAKALHLLPEKKQQEARRPREVLRSQRPAPQVPAAQVTGTLSREESLRSAGLQSTKSNQCFRSSPQAPRRVTVSPKPWSCPVPRRSVSPESIPQKLPF
ncbi:proline-rich protein 30-like [Peromyscus californicus insignis]|uniref:proline-rich protein 30-like n=1 Tax=Peromyscus californicus insignis TaxID=564181 RepID=UPI0022A75B1E|nr:proline-rich protein 30-like [Peromyscus californicus insignis]